jgi:Ca2+-binding EF-hand superfamily protein
MKHIDSEGLYSFIVNTARGDDSSHLDDEEVLKSERFSRVEFAACLKALLFGSTQGSPVAGPSENAFQQLQQFQIQIFRQLDHQSRGSVSVLEVLLALSLFLDRSPDEKLSLAFGILDFESSSSITEESLRIFFRASYSLLTALCTTANRTSVPSQPGSPLAPNSGPLSPSSLHSLPHEAIQARLASTAVHGAQEVMKLAGTKEKGRITFDEFARVTESHKPLFSFIHVFDLDDTFSPKAVDSAEATHRQSRFSDAMASASSGEEAQYSPRLSDESEEEEIIAPNSQGRAAALERQRQAAAAASSSSSRPAPRVNNFTSSLPGGSPSTFTDGPYSQMFQRR